jgi:hypothetical protein
MDKIVILTYNILSSSLATLMTNERKDNKIVYPIEIMNNDIRFKKISSFIKDQILIYSESNFFQALILVKTISRSFQTCNKKNPIEFS